MLSLLAGVVILVVDSPERAINYTTVYLIERSLSLDNLFVFILLFAYFAVPVELRARLLFFGIVFALVLRGAAILGGVALIERSTGSSTSSACCSSCSPGGSCRASRRARTPTRTSWSASCAACSR